MSGVTGSFEQRGQYLVNAQEDKKGGTTKLYLSQITKSGTVNKREQIKVNDHEISQIVELFNSKSVSLDAKIKLKSENLSKGQSVQVELNRKTYTITPVTADKPEVLEAFAKKDLLKIGEDVRFVSVNTRAQTPNQQRIDSAASSSMLKPSKLPQLPVYEKGWDRVGGYVATFNRSSAVVGKPCFVKVGGNVQADEKTLNKIGAALSHVMNTDESLDNPEQRNLRNDLASWKENESVEIVVEGQTYQLEPVDRTKLPYADGLALDKLIFSREEGLRNIQQKQESSLGSISGTFSKVVSAPKPPPRPDSLGSNRKITQGQRGLQRPLPMPRAVPASNTSASKPPAIPPRLDLPPETEAPLPPTKEVPEKTSKGPPKRPLPQFPPEKK